MESLVNFVRESNKIEGIRRDPTPEEILAHESLLALPVITVKDIVAFVAVVAPGKPLRNKRGLDVYVGNHVPPPGGKEIEFSLETLIARANGSLDAYRIHRDYETLHPFLDGNGRSGRAIWLWMMKRSGAQAFGHALGLGFLHAWYYQSLQNSRVQ